MAAQKVLYSVDSLVDMSVHSADLWLVNLMVVLWVERWEFLRALALVGQRVFE